MKATAIFGGGCFWCMEAVFQHVSGVLSVTSGYAGGNVDAPTYEQVCSGRTNHAEVVKVEYATELVNYDMLLDIFFASHDPTTLNQQGNDIGTQYRSVIFYLDEAQKSQAVAKIAWLNEKLIDKKTSTQIVTEVAAAPIFWPAEIEHQNYFKLNPEQGYCRVVIAPKLQKLGMHV